MSFYLGPLALLLLREVWVLGFWDNVKSQLEQHWGTYLIEIACEVLVANVILSDVMYSNLYVERSAQPKAAAKVKGPSVVKLFLLIVCPLLICVGGGWTILDTLGYFSPAQPSWHNPIADAINIANGRVGGKCSF